MNLLENFAESLILVIYFAGAKVLSCETVKVRLRDGMKNGIRNGDLEITMVSDTGSLKKHYGLALRLYLEGADNNPPMGAVIPGF